MDKAVKKNGHRSRLKSRFLGGEEASRTDEAILELLLTYAIPQRDVLPLTKQMLYRFGDLAGVLDADPVALSQITGVKTNTVTLIKAIDFINKARFEKKQSGGGKEEILLNLEETNRGSRDSVSTTLLPIRRKEATIFGKAVLKEAIQLLPSLPDTTSVEVIRDFLRKNLHFNSEGTRKRNAAYITQRLFPAGLADKAIRYFGKESRYEAEIKDVCFYRFCKAEPLMQDVMADLILPSLGMGRLSRQKISNYLRERFPNSKSISDGSRSIVDALIAGGVATASREVVAFSVRPIRMASFAFVLHSEFPEPGIYSLEMAESNAYFQSLLWTPQSILNALYELRNNGLISKVSEIDSIRQFTLKYDLEAVVQILCK